MERNTHESKLTQKQISKQLRFSDSTNKRYRDDIHKDSLYKSNKNKKKITKPYTSDETSKSVTNEQSKRNNQKVALL